MPNVGFLYDPVVLDHQPPAGHPERPERVRDVMAVLEDSGILDGVTRLPVRPATRGQLERVHDPRYLDAVEHIVPQGSGYLDAGDTVTSPGTWRAATAAAGAALGAVDAVMAGDVGAAFAADEQVAMPSRGRGGVNCFALLSRDNRTHWHLTAGSIDALWVSERLDALSLSIRRLTVVVLDNASVHVKAVQERAAVWQERGLFVFFLPPYGLRLNIADEEALRYAVWQAPAAVGRSLWTECSAFRRGQNSLT